ncbi:hypothetical protein [Streptomyces sp. NBC_00091]|uniref:hypothetical protein n=1 Tax=Streptomyces sp. NBC_00091 TaxID=2975648 RepID=UPI0022566556|nr:hypothetical protein [Streptomyces sp. NBC_00091]MCX5376782.1 hypothetical protein [Streptomyces sp. NBC_00091]
MALIRFNRPFDNIGEQLTSPAREPVTLAVSVAGSVLLLTPAAARELLYTPASDEELRSAVWRQAVVAAQEETAPDGEPWRLFAVWLTLPHLYRTVWRAASAFGASHADLQAEAVLALLETLAVLDPDQPAPGSTLAKAASRRAWALARQSAKETRVADIAAIAEARLGPEPSIADLVPEHAWELDIDPLPRPDGLCAPLRFTTSPARVEGERLGALAQGLGLRDIVHRARRPGEGTLIGTLSLRPAGAHR